MSGQEPSYAYNASAIGLGGVIRKGNKQTVIPTVASVCLASAGGEAINIVDNYCRDEISFTRAQSRVSGYSTPIKGNLHGRRFFTYADVLITNLQVFDRLKVNFMQATVTSTRDIQIGRDSLLELEPDQSRFTIRVFYHGVELDDEEVVPDVDLDLCHSGSYADFVQLLSGRDDLPDETRKLVDSVTRPAERTEVGKSFRPPINGPLLTVFDPRDPDKDKKHGRNQIQLPKFGRARFGDALVKPDRQRISLLRLNLDSDFVRNPLQSKAEAEDILAVRAVAAGEPEFSVAAVGDGRGGNLSSGDSGSNGVPLWP